MNRSKSPENTNNLEASFVIQNQMKGKAHLGPHHWKRTEKIPVPKFNQFKKFSKPPLENLAKIIRPF